MRKCYNFSAESSRVDRRSRGALLLPKPSGGSAPPPAGHGRDLCPPSSPSTSSTDARAAAAAAAALRVHSLAEKRRRERINNHLATLRRMIPDSNKMDKASLLARVIDQMRDLDRNAASIRQVYAIPSEMNEVIIKCENAEIKATLCCEDRPDLFSDLVKAFHTLKLTAIRAELTSLGGRSQNVITLCIKDANGSVCPNTLMESIRKVLARVVSSSEVAS